MIPGFESSASVQCILYHEPNDQSHSNPRPTCTSSQVTPHTISIASEDFATWVEDVKDVLGYSVACPNFLFHFRFVMVSASHHAQIQIHADIVDSRSESSTINMNVSKHMQYFFICPPIKCRGAGLMILQCLPVSRFPCPSPPCLPVPIMPPRPLPPLRRPRPPSP